MDLLAYLFSKHGESEFIRSDNGPEFIVASGPDGAPAFDDLGGRGTREQRQPCGGTLMTSRTENGVLPVGEPYGTGSS